MAEEYTRRGRGRHRKPWQTGALVGLGKKARRQSAGLLVFRRREVVVEVLLVHPGGPFWARKDDGAWSIPKGEIGEGEEAWAAAVREVNEELGWEVVSIDDAAVAMPLAPARQAGGKVVQAWALERDFDPTRLRSNIFEMEWPPRSGRRASFPEVDRAAWFGPEDARRKINAGQAALLDALEARLGLSR